MCACMCVLPSVVVVEALVAEVLPTGEMVPARGVAVLSAPGDTQTGVSTLCLQATKTGTGTERESE